MAHVVWFELVFRVPGRSRRRRRRIRGCARLSSAKQFCAKHAGTASPLPRSTEDREAGRPSIDARVALFVAKTIAACLLASQLYY